MRRYASLWCFAGVSLLLLTATPGGASPAENEEWLLDAAEQGDIETVRQLLKKGVNPNCRGEGGVTPLQNAAGSAEPGLVSLLLEAGADPSHVDEEGMTALMRVVYSCGQLLPEDSESQEPYRETARRLIRAGVPVNARDGEGLTALGWARRFEDQTLVPILTGAGATE
ncbi:MAG: ankyrin repeat domain-containing protein [Acidobacteriota bacterium]